MRRFAILAAALALAAPAGHAQQKLSRPGVYAGYTPRLYDGVVRSTIHVPVRDGTRLAVSIYRPAKEGRAVDTRYPVVFSFTPYRTRFRAPDGTIVDSVTSPPRQALADLVPYGYVVAVADVRGKGASFGHRRGFQDRTEALDGRDLIEWLAARPYSDGKVGMTGCSYLGGTTIQTATTLPPHLKAIFAGASDFDKYRFVRRGGLTAQFNTRPDEDAAWDLATAPVDADPDGVLLRQAVAEHAANTPMAALWYGMPYRDSVSPLTGTRFWEEAAAYRYAAKLRASRMAIYLWGTWHDDPVAEIVLGAANLPAKMLVGPGGHCEAPSGLSIVDEQRRFFDHYLKGVDNGIEREPRYAYITLNAPKESAWTQTNDLPGAGAKPAALFLGGGAGGLGPGRPEARQTAFTVNYDVGPSDAFAWWPAVQDDKGATFTSPPLAAPLTVRGHPVVRLRVAISTPEAYVFAYLEDMAPDGHVEIISHGRLAASHRKLGKAPYDAMGLPWHSGLKADVAPMVPGKAEDLALDLLPTSIIIAKDHRLRLTLAGADARQRNLDAVKITPAPVLTLSLGGAEGSVLTLPVVGDGPRF